MINVLKSSKNSYLGGNIPTPPSPLFSLSTKLQVDLPSCLPLLPLDLLISISYLLSPYPSSPYSPSPSSHHLSLPLATMPITTSRLPSQSTASCRPKSCLRTLHPFSPLPFLLTEPPPLSSISPPCLPSPPPAAYCLPPSRIHPPTSRLQTLHPSSLPSLPFPLSHCLYPLSRHHARHLLLPPPPPITNHPRSTLPPPYPPFPYSPSCLSPPFLLHQATASPLPLTTMLTLCRCISPPATPNPSSCHLLTAARCLPPYLHPSALPPISPFPSLPTDLLLLPSPSPPCPSPPPTSYLPPLQIHPPASLPPSCWCDFMNLHAPFKKSSLMK